MAFQVPELARQGHIFGGKKDAFATAKNAFRVGCGTTRYSEKKISQKCHFFRQCFKALIAVVVITH